MKLWDLKGAFSISAYYDRDRTAFYAALQGVREQGMDLTAWLDFCGAAEAVTSCDTEL